MTKTPKIEVGRHWRHELTKLRCWLTGFHAGRSDHGTLSSTVPGEDVLRQILVAIDDSEKPV